jgi:DNA-directed RNA polymerase subunit RPC12/RpoP
LPVQPGNIILIDNNHDGGDYPMSRTEYECKDCGRAFLVDEDERKKPICPSCGEGNIDKKERKPLPQWVIEKNNVKPG